MNKKYFQIIIPFLISANLHAQTINIHGILTSQPDNVPLANSIIKFYDAANTNNVLGTNTTNENGEFFNTLTDIQNFEKIENSAKLQAYLTSKTNGKLTFNINNFEKEKTQVEIYSLTGELVKKLVVVNNTTQWNQTNQRNEKVSNGLYILRAKTTDENLT